MWLSHKLALSLEDRGIDHTRVELLNYMDLSDQHFNKVHSSYRDAKYYLLQDSEIDWIKEDDMRLQRWLIYYLSHYESTEIPIRVSFNWPDAGKYHRVINALDIWDAEVDVKKSTIQTAKLLWSKNLLQDKKLKWLDPQNETQIEWAWRYINDNQQLKMHAISATSNQERYLGVMETFDCWQNPLELKDFRETMKRAWAQHKYRLNLNGRKQSTFVLSIEAKDQLQKMAKTQNVNLNQMLEYLINKEYISFKENLKKNKSHTNTPSIYPNNPPNPSSSTSAEEDA